MRIIVAIFCVLAWVCQVKADESKKTYEKKFSKAGLEELVVNNTHGKIEVTQHEGEEIEVTAEMKVIAKTAAKADETLELVQILETPSDSYLKLETKFGKEMGLAQFFTGMSISINYKINIPKGLKLRLISSNGNIYFGNFEGEVSADIRNGDFKAAVLKGGEVYVKQDNGNFSVEDVGSLEGEFKNCMIRIESGDNLRLNTASCDARLASVDKLNIRSNSGTLKIGNVEDIIGSSSFTKYEIQDLANLLDMDMRMGEMNVRNVQVLFSEIRLKGSFTKVGLTFPDSAGYKLELKRNKSLKLDLPRNMSLEERPTTERNMTVGTKFVGDPKYTGKVVLDLSNGSLFIQ
ncbi:MAG: DUF4097 family beta strand repeat-containing protein [Odoribacter sp.]|nr:DUF4097 family beta strand repeat-containing protein [Odoribacter sp.]